MTGLDALALALTDHGTAHTPSLAPAEACQALVDAFEHRLAHHDGPLRRQHNARWEVHQRSADGFVVNPVLNPHGLQDFPEVAAAAVALIESARLRACAEAILGGPPALHQTAYYDSGLGSTPHRDDHPSRPDAPMVAVLVALEDIHPDGGPFVFWPDTHAIEDPELDRLQRAVWTRRHVERAEASEEARALQAHLDGLLAGRIPSAAVLPKGDALWWSRRTVHGSLAPQVGAGHSRRSFIAHFVRAEDLTA